MVQLSHPYMTTEKTVALTRQTFVDKVLWNFKGHPLKWSKEAQLSGQAEYLQEEVEFLMVETLAPSNLNC